jgi:glutamine synthetase
VKAVDLASGHSSQGEASMVRMWRTSIVMKAHSLQGSTVVASTRALEEPADQEMLSSVETVVICVPDNIGRLIGKRLDVDQWPTLFESGLSMPNFHLVTDIENKPIPGIEVTGSHTGYPNGVLRPDAATLRNPDWESATAYVLADAYTSDGDLVDVAPRAILRRQEREIAARGLSALIASELEFYLYSESYPDHHADGYRDLTPAWHFHGDNDVFVTTAQEPFLRRIRQSMRGMGITVSVTQGENGPGQQELNFHPTSVVEMADRHVLYKHGVKSIARLEGKSVTFMAKPDDRHPGSGAHTHISLYDDRGESIFGVDDLSEAGGAFLAGVLRFTPELAWLHAPFANSYRRFQPGSMAPTSLSWGWDNRGCAVRALDRGTGIHFEFKFPGADMNPYFSFTGLIIAGLEGMRLGLTPPPPTRGNAYLSSDSPPVPGDLTEAVHFFEVSDLAVRELTEPVHAHLCGLARAELSASRRAVTDWDRKRGFERA